MDVGLHQVVDGRIDQPVPGHRGYAAEGLGDDGDPEMAVAARRPRMAGMQMALVLDDQQRGRKTVLQAAGAGAVRGWGLPAPMA